MIARGSASSSRIRDDAASRNGLKEVRTTGRIAVTQLDPAAAARAALFEYMIGNTDWSMRAGPAGRHLLPQFPADRRGSELAVRASCRCPTTSMRPGLVNAPYAAAAGELRTELGPRPPLSRLLRAQCAGARGRRRVPGEAGQICSACSPRSRSSTRTPPRERAAYLEASSATSRRTRTSPSASSRPASTRRRRRLLGGPAAAGSSGSQSVM